MFIHTVCQALERAKIPYAIVGGYAVALHGAVRGTVDVDFVIKWTLENLQKVEHTFKELGLVSRVPVNSTTLFNHRQEYIEKRNFLAWNFYNPNNLLEQVGLIINYDLQNAHTKQVHTTCGTIQILARDELIAMKKISGRPQDLEDIKALGES